MKYVVPAIILIVGAGCSPRSTDGQPGDVPAEIPLGADLDPEAESVDEPCLCGDGVCDSECAETNEVCPQDCCICGDGLCQDKWCGEGWEEGAWTCSADCAECGNGACDPGEGPVKCPEDCCGACGDGQCKGGLCAENPEACPQDCSASACGNEACEPGENPIDCPTDCEPYECGNSTCEPGESPEVCPQDCAATCGDCSCKGGETYSSCPVDCGFCGDGYCYSLCPFMPENGANCLADCCETDCAGRECGSDGCGGSCGQCGVGKSCSGDGLCTDCQPDCAGTECGSDGCGGECGQCSEGEKCLLGGTCGCVPDCTGLQCGPNVCGFDCGGCPPSTPDCEAGKCVSNCVPQCNGKECGADLCGGDCGSCQAPSSCVDDKCLCEPQCDGKECGPDKCGGQCGTCPGNDKCLVSGDCYCVPDCEGKVCGPDGCGGVCGKCVYGHDCKDGQCQCMLTCVGKECGDGGCGGWCGDCPPGEFCVDDGVCMCVPDCLGKACGDDGCGGECGPCPEEMACKGTACIGDGICNDANDVPWDGCNAGVLAEFQVNEPGISEAFDAATAVLANSDFVIVWRGLAEGEEPGTATAIYGKLYGSEGSSKSEEFVVNAEDTPALKHPEVSALAGGGFVVVWVTNETGFTGMGVVGQRFNSEGSKLGPIFAADQWGLWDDSEATVAGLSSGGFVVAWQNCPLLDGGPPGHDGSGCGIYSSRFDASAVMQGAEFQVNTTTDNKQGRPATAALSNGGFVVAWESLQGTGWDVYSQTYDSGGGAASLEAVVNSTPDDSQYGAAVAGTNQGQYVVVWSSNLQDGSQEGVIGRMWEGDGTPKTEEFFINELTEGAQYGPRVASPGGGNFLTVWTSSAIDGSDTGIAGRMFDTSGSPKGSEFQVNVYAPDKQEIARVAARQDAVNPYYVVVWTSHGQTGGTQNVFAQRFNGAGKKLYH